MLTINWQNFDWKKWLLFLIVATAVILMVTSCSRKVFKQKTETKSESTKVVKVDSVVKKKSTNTTYKRVTKKLKKSIEVDLDTTRYWGNDSGYWDVNTAQDYITEVGDTKIKTRQPVSKIILKSSDNNDSVLYTKNVLTNNVNLKKSDSGKVVKQSTVVTKDKKSSFPFWIIFLIVAIIIIAGWTDHKYNWIDKLLKF